MRLVLLKFALLCLLSTGPVACSFFQVDVVQDSSSLAVVGKEEKAPFILAVEDELFDGSMLHVQARLTGREEAAVAGAVVRLRGISHGEVVEEESVSVVDLLPAGQKTLSVGESYETVLSVSAEALSDYQLELIWGEREGSAPALMAALSLKGVEIKKRLLCAREPCEIAFSLTGSLYNAGNAVISEAELGVGYVFVKSGASLDLSGVIPENEELLKIRSLSLSAGEVKPFKLKLSQTVPERSDGEFMPIIRVLSYQ